MPTMKGSKKEGKNKKSGCQTIWFRGRCLQEHIKFVWQENKSVQKISVIPESFPYSRTSSEPWNWKWRRFPYKRQASASICSYTSTQEL